PVLLVQPVPMLSTPAGDCAVIRVLTSSCLRPVPRRKVDAKLRQAFDVDQSVAASMPATRTISFEDVACTQVNCSSVRHDVLLYRDSRHLSVQGAELLTPRFYRAIVTGTRSGREHARTRR
ncbi:MAG TPA: SGNH hydrolase domain-containing protein, partial [Gaiellaceae bacterium]